jgi:hypothetical protein
MNTEQTWQEIYHVAVLETNWLNLEDHIRATESAIEKRLQGFNLDHGGTPEENQAILDIVQKLNGLRGELALWRASKDLGSSTLEVSD